MVSAEKVVEVVISVPPLAAVYQPSKRYQHVTARVLPQQHGAEGALRGGLPPFNGHALRLHQRREQEHTRGGQPVDAAPLPPAGVVTHPFFDKGDPSCGIVHIVCNLLSVFLDKAAQKASYLYRYKKSGKLSP